MEGFASQFGCPSTVHDRFQEWRKAGVFEKLWRAGVLEYDAKIGLDWEWQSMDGAITKAPLGGKGISSALFVSASAPTIC